MNRSVYFYLTGYIFAHGRKPRGYGSWAFVFGKKDYDNVDEVSWAPAPSTFSAAKKWAYAEAIKRGVDLVGVCS
jgi:hypothetical protein